MVQIVYWVGVALSVWCIYDLFSTRKETGMPLKIVIAVLLFFFSWIGTVVYYFILRDKLK